MSENTALAYPTVFRIVSRLTNLDALVRNPPLFLQEETIAIRRIELDEMLRQLTYTPSGQRFPLEDFEAQLIRHSYRIQPTPQRGLYDGIVFDSEIYKIKCAICHFAALGVEARVNFQAPVKDYAVFKRLAE